MKFLLMMLFALLIGGVCGRFGRKIQQKYKFNEYYTLAVSIIIALILINLFNVVLLCCFPN